MVHSADIGLELKGISEVVAGLPPVNPFVVPEGFFVHFSEKVLALVRNLEEEAPGEVAPMLTPSLRDRSTLEAPPPGYFDGFAENLMRRIRVEEAGSTAQAGDAANAPRPAGTLETPVFLQSLRPTTTLRVPQGYFDGLPERMLALAKAAAPENVAEELHELSPLLASLSRTYPGTVPAGYFEAFSAARGEAIVVAMPEATAMHEAPAETTGAPVIPIGSARRSVRQVLAAAVTVGVMLTSALWGYHIYLRPSSNVQNEMNLNSPDQLNNVLAKVPDQAIIDYLKSNTDVSDAEMASEVDEQQLPNAVDNGKTGNDSKASE